MGKNLQTFIQNDFAYLFCVRKVAAKHRKPTPCYPRGMEMFLIATVTALLTVMVVVPGQKRLAFLCQQ